MKYETRISEVDRHNVLFKAKKKSKYLLYFGYKMHIEPKLYLDYIYWTYNN